MQGVLVFASSAARAAAITSPQEGQYSYLKDTNSTEYYDGAAWIAAPIGDITGVTAGVGISGGGTSGTVTVTNSMATEITAAGDIIVGTGSGTFDNLPIGTTAQVLTADTTVSPYKVKWATPASTATSYTLLNSGGTALTGAATITISGISGINSLFVQIANGSSASGNSNVYVRFNGDNASNYGYFNGLFIAPDRATNDGTNSQSLLYIGATAGNAASNLAGYFKADGCNSSGIKVTQHSTGSTAGGASNAQFNVGGGRWSGTATVSSISFTSDTSNWDAGTIYVYGA
jgi:hypothetical protein